MANQTGVGLLTVGLGLVWVLVCHHTLRAVVAP